MSISTVNVHKSQHLQSILSSGYLCMGINNSQSFLESWHLPPTFLSLAGQTRESCPWDYSSLPYFSPLPPSLSSSPFTHFTHLQPDGLLTEMKLKSHSNILLVKPHFQMQAFKLPERRGDWAPAYVSTEQHNFCMESTVIITERINANGRGSAGRGQRHYTNDRDRITPNRGSSLRVHHFQAVGSRQNLDANQSN